MDNFPGAARSARSLVQMQVIGHRVNVCVCVCVQVQGNVCVC